MNDKPIIDEGQAVNGAVYAVVELMGHARIAGQITESPMAGGALIRVSVPKTDAGPAHTRDINPKAVYAIHYCDEAAMMCAARHCDPSPVVAIVANAVREQMALERKTMPAQLTDGDDDCDDEL